MLILGQYRSNIWSYLTKLKAHVVYLFLNHLYTGTETLWEYFDKQ